MQPPIQNKGTKPTNEVTLGVGEILAIGLRKDEEFYVTEYLICDSGDLGVSHQTPAPPEPVRA